MCFGMFQNFYPTYLQEAAGMSVAESALPATISTVVTIPVSLVIGIVIDRYNIRKWTLVFGHLLLGFTMGWIAWVGSGSTWVVTAVIVGLVQGFLPVALRLLIPFQVTDQRKMDYILGIMAFVTNLGSFYSGPFGAIVAGVGWLTGGLVGILPIALAFAVICIVFVKGDRKVLASDAKDQKLLEQEATTV